MKDLLLSDEGLLSETPKYYWAVLGNKGCQGAAESFLFIHFKKFL